MVLGPFLLNLFYNPMNKLLLAYIAQINFQI